MILDVEELSPPGTLTDTKNTLLDSSREIEKACLLKKEKKDGAEEYERYIKRGEGERAALP